MGGGIAMNFANVGIPVHIVETNQDQLDKGLSNIRIIMKDQSIEVKFRMNK